MTLRDKTNTTVHHTEPLSTCPAPQSILPHSTTYTILHLSHLLTQMQFILSTATRMSQEYVRRYKARELNLRLAASSAVLQSLEEYPIEYNCKENINFINLKSDLSNYSLILQAVIDKAFDLIETHSRQLGNENTEHLSKLFEQDQKRITKKFNNDVTDLLDSFANPSYENMPNPQQEDQETEPNQRTQRNDKEITKSQEFSLKQMMMKQKKDTFKHLKKAQKTTKAKEKNEENIDRDLNLSETSGEDTNDKTDYETAFEQKNKDATTRNLSPSSSSSSDNSQQETQSMSQQITLPKVNQRIPANKKQRLEEANHQPEEQEWKCLFPFCQCSYKSWGSLAKHLRNTHKNNNNSCDMCNKHFDEWKSLLHHYKYEHVINTN